MRTLTPFSALPLATLILAFSWPNANAQTQLPVEMQQKIDKVAHDALAKTGVPSASLAVVRDRSPTCTPTAMLGSNLKRRRSQKCVTALVR